MWADKIGDELRRLEFFEPEGWTATYILYESATHVVVFVLYVDDLIMFGTGRVLEIVKKVRANIKMDDPTQLQKYLGVVHHVIRKETGGETITQSKTTVSSPARRSRRSSPRLRPGSRATHSTSSWRRGETWPTTPLTA